MWPDDYAPHNFSGQRARMGGMWDDDLLVQGAPGMHTFAWPSLAVVDELQHEVLHRRGHRVPFAQYVAKTINRDGWIDAPQPPGKMLTVLLSYIS
jgi:hypothetical protein